jgi:hypothetical protein
MADILQTQMPALPTTQGLFKSSTATKPEYITAEKMAPAMEESRQARTGLLQQIDTTASEQQRLETERNVGREQEKLRLREEEARLVEKSPERLALKTARDELKNAAFVPKKDTAKDIATLFSLTSIVGMAIGGDGKASAFNAMAAMNGMIEGYQKGRTDLYKREKDVFEKNLKLLQGKVTLLQSELQEAMQTYKTNRELGEQKAEIAFAKAGSDIGAQKLKQQGLVRAVEYIDGVAKDTSALVNMANDQVKRSEDMAFKDRQQTETERANKAQERDRMLDRQLREKLEREKQNASSLKPSAKIQEAFIADNQLKADLGAIRARLQDPKLLKQIADYRAEAFFSEEGYKFISQLLQKQIPPELRQFLTQVSDMRNNYYLSISGKAVTQGEAMRSYGTVPQPGDSAEKMLNNIDGMERRVGQKVEIMRYMYSGLPNLEGKLRPGGKTSLVPNENYSIGAQDQAPAASTQKYMLNNREIVPRGNKWVYADTGEDAK